MNAFKSALKDGNDGEDVIANHYDKKFKEIKGYKGFKDVPIEDQKDYGDICFKLPYKDYYVEVKTDSGAGETGNIVVETESNMGKTPGWLHGYKYVDIFIYYYNKGNWGIVVPWRQFQDWVLTNKDRWKVVNQNKYKQMNIPVNYLVPYQTILDECEGAKRIEIER